MPINIQPASFEFVTNIDDRCGISTPRNAALSEYFGPYQTERDWGFLFYDAAKAEWRKERPEHRREPHPPALAPDDSLTEDETESLADALMIGDLTSTPPNPVDPAQPANAPPFVYMGWKLAWLYVPQLRRWELAPLGHA